MDDLAKLLQGVTDTQRRRLFMRYIVGCTYQEIGWENGKVSPQAAFQSIKRAIRRLRKYAIFTGFGQTAQTADHLGPSAAGSNRQDGSVPKVRSNGGGKNKPERQAGSV